MRAYSGQEKNQLILVELTSPGKFLQRTLKFSPAGLIHNTICKFLTTRSVKNSQSSSEESPYPYFLADSLRLLFISFFFASSNKLFIIPTVNIVFICSKKLSSDI